MSSKRSLERSFESHTRVLHPRENLMKDETDTYIVSGKGTNRSKQEVVHEGNRFACDQEQDSRKGKKKRWKEPTERSESIKERERKIAYTSYKHKETANIHKNI